jgi:hypothetical protein
MIAGPFAGGSADARANVLTSSAADGGVALRRVPPHRMNP